MDSQEGPADRSVAMMASATSDQKTDKRPVRKRNYITILEKRLEEVEGSASDSTEASASQIQREPSSSSPQPFNFKNDP
jgi:hypothetical protein